MIFSREIGKTIGKIGTTHSRNLGGGKIHLKPKDQLLPIFNFIVTTRAICAVAAVLIAASYPFQGAGSLEPEDVSLPTFTDIRQEAGIVFRHRASPTDQKYLIETMGGGVAMLDFNRDGWLDVFFVNGGRLENPMKPGTPIGRTPPDYTNHLYLNNGDGTFSDVSQRSGIRDHGYGMGAAVGDYDNDGFPDLYVTNFGFNDLYRNNGDGTFTNATTRAGVAAGGWSASAGFLDYDNDGWLDLFVTRYLNWDFDKNLFCGDPRPGYRGYCHPSEFDPIDNFLYRNNGDGTFADVSAGAGIRPHRGMALGVAFNDYDNDGWTDILVANDSMEQFLFRNLGEGTFAEKALEAGVAYNEDGGMFAGMGVDFNDYDNDGKPDLIITDLSNERYSLYRNTDSGFFSYATSQTGLGRITLSFSGWGVRFFDYDNDGWKDLFVAQGHVMDNIELTNANLRYLQPPLLVRNIGKRFEDVSAIGGSVFDVPRAGRGVAFGDLDNDGNVDLLVGILNDFPLVLHNEGGSGANHWLLIDAVGTKSNRDGLGAKIKVVGESGFTQYGYVTTAGSYLSAGDKRVHFGLGADTVARLIEVRWPSGVVQTLKDIKADQVLTITELDSSARKE